jgi:hypothetical protein
MFVTNTVTWIFYIDFCYISYYVIIMNTKEKKGYLGNWWNGIDDIIIPRELMTLSFFGNWRHYHSSGIDDIIILRKLTTLSFLGNWGQYHSSGIDDIIIPRELTILPFLGNWWHYHSSGIDINIPRELRWHYHSSGIDDIIIPRVLAFPTIVNGIVIFKIYWKVPLVNYQCYENLNLF